MALAWAAPDRSAARPGRLALSALLLLVAVAFAVPAQAQTVPVITIAAGGTFDDPADGDTENVTTGSSVTEGRAAGFTLSRTGSTTAALTVNVSVTETGRVVFRPPSSVTFAAGASTATLIVRTALDSIDAADSVVTATVTASTASTATYTVGTPASATVTVLDDDTRGVTVSPTALTVTEGATGTYTVVLDSVPIVDDNPTDFARVRVTLSSSNRAVTVSPATLLFLTRTWATPQTVTVTAVQDTDADDHSATISHTVRHVNTPFEGDYDSVTVPNVTVTVTDDDKDKPVVTIEPWGRPPTEGSNAAFRVSRGVPRTGTWREALTVQLRFTETGAMLGTVPTSVTIPGRGSYGYFEVPTLDDTVEETDSVVTATVIADTASPYRVETPSFAMWTVRDNDRPGVTVSPLALTVTEGATGTTYAVKLNTPPTGDVTVTPSSSNPAVTVSPAMLQFTASNWATAQTVTVTAEPDADAADDSATIIHHAVAGGNYGSVTAANVSVTVRDDDTAPSSLPAVTIAAGTTPVTEGTAAGFTLSRTGSTTAALSVNVSVSETGSMVATANKGAKAVTFQAGQSAATLSVDTVGDSVVEADSVVTATVTANTANPATYQPGTPASAAVTVRDDDTAPSSLPAVTIAAGTTPVTEGTAAGFTLSRTGSTTAELSVNVSVSETGSMVVTANKGAKTVTFQAGQSTATLSVDTVGDSVVEADSVVTATVTANPATYQPGTPASAAVTVRDDDTGDGGGGGGGEDGGGGGRGTANNFPTAGAGPDQSGVREGLLVTLDGSGSSHPEDEPLRYRWNQLSGEPVVLSSQNIVNPTFTAPRGLTTDAVLRFRLLVTDPSGRFDSDTVTITVEQGSSPPLTEDQIYYFPHLAVGGGWQTTITYINYSPQEVSCQTDFLSDQGTPLMVSFAGRGTVASRTDVLTPGGSVHPETNVGLSAPLAPGWARAICTGPVKASLLYRQHNSEGMPVAEAAVNATTVPATRFVTFAEQGEGKDGTGVAYANPSATSAMLTFTARDAAGEVLASDDLMLSPNGHGAQNMAPLFDLSSFTGSLEVTSTEPIVSLSLNFEAAPVFSSLPPGELDAAAQGSTTYYFPHLAVGASWQTTITYINYSSQEVSCETDFLADFGSPLMVSFAGLGTVVSRSDVLPPGGSVHQETNVELSAPLAPGWARATCSGPVKASLLYRRRNSEGAPTGEAGVNATTVPATRFVTFAEQGEGKQGTGVAYANPSATSAMLTFTARDAAGQVLASVDRTLLPNGHDAQNMAPLFDLSSFTGSLEVTSTEPIVSLSLNFEAAPVFSSLPPGELDDAAQ